MSAADLLRALTEGDVRFVVEIKRASSRPKDRAIVPLLEAVIRRRPG